MRSIYTLVLLTTPPNDLLFVEVPLLKTLHILMVVPNHALALQIVQTFQPDFVLFEETVPTTGLQFLTFLRLQSGLERVPTVIFQGVQQDAEKKSFPTPDLIILLEMMERLLSFSKSHLLSVMCQL